MRSQPSPSNPSLPGCEARQGEALQRKANAPIKPPAPQAPCDIGLFGDAQNQRDLFDQMLRECFAPKARP